MLSHDVNRGITTGFAKGTPSSDIVEAIKHLKACVLQIGHPLLLPIIIFSHDVSFKTDIKQRDARDWLRRLEHAVSMRSEIEEKEGYVNKEGVVDLDAVNRDLVECHSQVLWKRPKAYLELLRGIERGMERFMEKLPQERRDEEMVKLQDSMMARMDFYKAKLQGIESYAYTTLQRLDIQRSAVGFFPFPSHFPRKPEIEILIRSKIVIQYNRPKRIQIKLPNGRRTTQVSTRLQTRQCSDENHLPPGSHILPWRISRVGL